MADLLEIDTLSLYFGEPYQVTDTISVLQPTIGQIIHYGEKEYFSMVHTITAIPSDMKSQLWDMGLDWMQVSDFELFMMLSQTLPMDKTEIVLGDIDLSALRPYQHPQNPDMIILADIERGVVIDEFVYLRIVNYLRKLHNITPKIEHAKNEFTKNFLIEEDRQRLAANATKPYESFLAPLISSVKVRQGYSLDYIKNEYLYEFFDDINRLQIIHNADALLQGCYSGNIDMSKINKKELDWMRPVSSDSTKSQITL